MANPDVVEVIVSVPTVEISTNTSPVVEIVENANFNADLSSYATISFVENTSGVIVARLSGITDGVISLNSLTGNITLDGINNTIIVSGQTLFISGSQNVTGYLTTGNADLRYYSITNPSGFITGFDSGQYVTTGQTGQFASSSALLNAVFLTGNQTISGIKNFVSRPTVNGVGVLLSGEATSSFNTTGIVYQSGQQNITGQKNFQSGVGVSPFLNVTGSGYFSGNVTVVGHFQATTKSFLIDHPTLPNAKLQYGVLEGDCHSVYIKGKSDTSFIRFPHYWSGLIDLETVSVSLTPIGIKQSLWVTDIDNHGVYISSDKEPYYFYQIFAERKDVPKLEVEIC